MGLILGPRPTCPPSRRGKPVDRRADAWSSFASLPWETPHGPLFAGATVMPVIGGCSRGAASTRRVAKATRRPARSCPSRCPLKDHPHAAAHIGGARLELQEVLSRAPPPCPRRRQRTSRKAQGAAAPSSAGPGCRPRSWHDGPCGRLRLRPPEGGAGTTGRGALRGRCSRGPVLRRFRLVVPLAGRPPGRVPRPNRPARRAPPRRPRSGSGLSSRWRRSEWLGTGGGRGDSA